MMKKDESIKVSEIKIKRKLKNYKISDDKMSR